jgi:hypothetical protein
MQRRSAAEIAVLVDQALAMIPSVDERDVLDGLMTPAEHRAMDMTADLYNLLCAEVIGHDRSREGDVAEIAADIHHIQERILAQAAARAFPDRYRLLGGEIVRHDIDCEASATGSPGVFGPCRCAERVSQDSETP